MKRFFTAVIAVLVFTCTLLAQTSTSQITGTVHDPSGAVVPGAQVTATNEETGVTYRQQTNGAGLYAFPSVPIGRYTIVADLKGFRTTRATGNVLVVNTPLTIDVTMEVGANTDVVEVAASAEQLQTSNAAVGAVVEQKAALELPLNGRNPLTLLVLQPGVVQRSYGAAGSGVHVNGSRDRAFNVTIDGIDANESTVPNPVSNLYRLTPDNIQEYKVTTSNATPEEGRNSGANISIATRQGTNQFHGTMFEFLRNTALNSNEFFANAQGASKPDIKLNQYGFELSGPVRKNKTFFFFSWAGQKINTTQPVDQTYGVVTVYTPSALSGVYRYFAADPKNPLTLNGQVIARNGPGLVNPHTGALLPGVRNCASPSDLNCVQSYNFAADDPKHTGVDSAIAKLFGSYPQPNTYNSGDGLNTAGYTWNPPANFRGPNYMARADHTFNQNNTMFARVLWGSYNTREGDPLNGRPQVFPGFPPLGEVFRTTRNFAASYRHVFSPSMVNEFTAGLSRFIFLFTQGEANPNWPNVVPYSFANVTLPYINTPRTYRAVTTPQLIDNLSLIKGSHLIRGGINFRFYQHNDQRGQPGGTNVTPTLSFSASVRPPTGFNTPAVATSTVAGINSTDNTRLLGAINDIMGIPARLSQNFLGAISSNTFLPFLSGNSVTLWNEGQRLKQYDSYIQDEWKLRRNLTVTFGLRWEVNTAPTEAGGRVYVPNLPIDGSKGPVTFVHADRWFGNNNVGALGPRLGIAWSPDSRTVIRAGWGVSFDTVSSFQATAVAGKVPGLVFNCSSIPGGTTTPGCSSVPDVRIAQSFPNYLPPPSTQPSAQLTPPAQLLSNAPAAIAFDPNLKLPTVHEWNLTIQRETKGGLVLEVGYLGHRGIRLFRAYDLNQINADPILPSFLIMQQNVAKGCKADGTGCTGGTPVPLVTSGILTSAFVTSSTTSSDLANNAAGNFAGRIEQTTLAAHLRPNQQFGTITYLDSGGDSYYHAAQATLRKRFQAGLMFAAAYTFSKSIDDQSVDPVGSSSGGGLSTTTSRAPIDIRNWKNERAVSDFNRTHVLSVSSVYELPVGRGKPLAKNAPGFLNHVIGGWNVNGVFTAMTGERFSVRSGALTENYSHQSRADLVGPLPSTSLQEVPGVMGPVVFPNANAFAIPAPGGDGMGRNMFVGPGYWNLDLGITKKFDLTERVTLQFRTEMFNALNHPNFDTPVNSTTGTSSILGTTFGQTCCATVAPPSTQTIIQTGESARIIQLALKLSF
ncbi:MAG: TonB-dependent receptor [Acidobacteriia bacterium]|nr:TonB-dependent receptor [Terriglobia bacterium]